MSDIVGAAARLLGRSTKQSAPPARWTAVATPFSVDVPASGDVICHVTLHSHGTDTGTQTDASRCVALGHATQSFLSLVGGDTTGGSVLLVFGHFGGITGGLLVGVDAAELRPRLVASFTGRGVQPEPASWGALQLGHPSNRLAIRALLGGSSVGPTPAPALAAALASAAELLLAGRLPHTRPWMNRPGRPA